MRFLQIRQLALVFYLAMLSGECARGTDVHDLLSSGIIAPSQDLDHLIEEKNYPEFERELPSAKLTRNDRLYFEGVLADRLNQPERAIASLEKVLPELITSNRKRAVVALDALGQDDFMMGRYSEATARYTELLRRFDSFLDEAERRAAKDNRDTFGLLGNSASQTISGERSFSVPIRQDRLGDIDVPLKIGASSEWWIFDTGANITTITRSTAKRLGLSISKGHAQTQSGPTGAEVSLSTAIIPDIAFGRAVIHNVVVLVMDDKDLNIDIGARQRYQINGILGYPVLAELGRFTVRENAIEIGSSLAPSTRMAGLYVEELTPLIAAAVSGKNIVFQLDTGNTGADLTARFLKEFPERFTSLKPEQGRSSGAGGAHPATVYRLPELQLNFGSAAATLKNVSLFAGDRGEFLDKLYGNLGQAVLRQFRSYTIDFTHMQLMLGTAATR